MSGEPIAFDQDVLTRLRLLPAVQSYDPVTGWANSTAKTVDVKVTINQHKGVPLQFTTNQLASTVRNLFQEQAEPMTYALALDVVNYLIGLITPANFQNEYVKALPDVNRTTLVGIGNALDNLLNPTIDRTALLHHSYYNKLKEDPYLVAYQYTGQVETLTKGSLSEVDGLLPVKSQTMTDGQNLFGLGFTSSALAFASRIPNDYSSIWSDLPPTGIVETITEPTTGLSLMMVRFINHQGAWANARVALMYGAAPGQANAGVRIVSVPSSNIATSAAVQAQTGVTTAPVEQ